MRRCCEVCGRIYDAKTKRSRFCTSTCRSRNMRGAEPPPIAALIDVSLESTTKQKLEDAGVLDTVLGQQAMRLAVQMSVETGSSLAALSRELRATMLEALSSGEQADDVVDELRARREARRAAAH